MKSLIYYQERIVRFVGSPDRPEWVGKDVCDLLGYRHHQEILARLPENEKGVTVCDTLGGPQTMITVNEAGFYRLIFGSKLPEAESIKHWVFHEVLPSIRRHGLYVHPRAGLPELLERELEQIPAGRKEYVLQQIDLMEEIAASANRAETIRAIVTRHRGFRGFAPRSVSKRFYRWEKSGRDWKTLDRWNSLYGRSLPALPAAS